MKLRFLVAAGPTREAIDPVRYLSNASSGKTGFAIAEAAVRSGHAAVLVAGPVALPTPEFVRRIDVISARDMLAALETEHRRCDVLVMAAAVADYRPRRVHRSKVKKSKKTFMLELIENPDILKRLAAKKGDRVHVGFALETEREVAHAAEKLAKKKLDFVVANGPENLDRDEARAVFVDRRGVITGFLGSKAALGKAIVDLAAALAARGKGASSGKRRKP